MAKKNFGGDHRGFFIDGRGGIARGVATLEVDGSIEEAEASSATPYLGVGAGYDFSETFGLSLLLHFVFPCLFGSASPMDRRNFRL